jgi:site-specific DNA-cytosine methylase
MLENVPGLVSMANGAIIRKICTDLASLGYDVKWDILDAADYGVPQRRRRVIILGKRVDIMNCDFETGRMALYLGAAQSVTHPDWFEKKFPQHRAGGTGITRRN